MKILISTDTYFPHVNGCSYFSQRLARYLAKDGHEVCVLAPSASRTFTRQTVDGVTVYGIKSLPVFFYKDFRFCLPFFSNKSIKKIVDGFKPDIIHLQGHFFVSRAVLSAAKKNNIPVVATNHFMPENLVHYLPFSKIIGPVISKIAWMDFSRVFHKAGQITTPTKIAANLIQPHFKTSITPLSCGIDTTIFNPSNESAFLRERYKIDNRPVLLYVGRLDKEKNLDVVIRAFAEAKKKINIQLVIAGTGVEKDSLVKLVNELALQKDVCFTGFVPDVDLPHLYTLATCFIIAGIAELQSIVTMEAMASRLPVLAVNAMALPELVEDSYNGFLFEIDDPEKIAEKIVIIFNNDQLREEMAAHSLKKIEKHAIKNTIKEFEAIYNREIAKHGSNI